MTQSGRSLAWRWIMLGLSLMFALAWPTLRPESRTWAAWTPPLWVAGLVWLAWCTKNWLLGLITGLTAIFHPDNPTAAVATPLGVQLASLTLAASWCAQWGELVSHPQAGWKSWLSWTLVGCAIAVPLSWQDRLFLGLTLGLFWLACGTLILLWGHYHSDTKTWRQWITLLSPAAVSGAALVSHWFWSAPETAASWQWDGHRVYEGWRGVMETFLHWPNWLGGIWVPSLLLIWAWWRTLRRAIRCAKQGNAPVALALTWFAPWIIARTLLDVSPMPAAVVPMAALLLGYLVFDLLQYTFEKMRLEPPISAQTSAATQPSQDKRYAS